MTDAIMRNFLGRQREEALALSVASDLVTIAPLERPEGGPADRFFVRFACRGLVRTPDGLIVEAADFAVGIWFPENYLRTADPFRVLTWLGPRQVWHPNISDRAPAICVGRLAPGTSLVDLVYQCWEIITWNKVTMREDDALNLEACQWARSHLTRLPVDTRPLKRRAPAIRAAQVSPGAGHAAL
jgi:hypothetical protein